MNALDKKVFGITPNNETAYIFRLQNKNGLIADITNYGATLVNLFLPDKDGLFEDVVLGFDDLDGFINHDSYFGSTVGRYANRIGNGEFSIGDTQFKVAKNDNGLNHLHGGEKGFDRVFWEYEIVNEHVISFSYQSVDGEEGYPGDVSVKVTYSLNDENSLIIDYVASTNKLTPINLTNHSYFNLSGDLSSSCLDHVLQINADTITAIDEGSIPTGELMPVTGTAFDFRSAKGIGQEIENDEMQLLMGKGYDHNFILNGSSDALSHCATVVEPRSKRKMVISTTQPGVQLYSGNFLDGSIKGKNGISYQKRNAFCLETQHFPDSPNQPSFPNTLLKPGEVYQHQTCHTFSVDS